MKKKYFLLFLSLIIFSKTLVGAVNSNSSNGSKSFTYNPSLKNTENISKSTITQNAVVISTETKKFEMDELLNKFDEIKITMNVLQNQIINFEKVIHSFQIVQSTQIVPITQSTQLLKSSDTIISKQEQLQDNQLYLPVFAVKPQESNKLIFVKKEIKKIGAGYFMVLQFKPFKKIAYSEDMKIEISVQENSNSEIQNISSPKLKSGKATTSISSDGKTATLFCALSSEENLAITLLFSQKTMITVKGNNDLAPLTLNFEN